MTVRVPGFGLTTRLIGLAGTLAIAGPLHPAPLVAAPPAPPTAAEPAPADETQPAAPDDWKPLFDGRTLAGWEGDRSVFRVEDGAIVGGFTDRRLPHNFFLATTEEFADFELRLQFRLVGESTNAGIQLRSRRIPDHHEMIGYQADLGQDYWGCLYDESRRREILARPDPDVIRRILRRDDWNEYRIVCEGPRVRLWINGTQTVDYRESDASLEQTGRIALQIHGGPPGEAWYRNIRLRRLPADD